MSALWGKQKHIDFIKAIIAIIHNNLWWALIYPLQLGSTRATTEKKKKKQEPQQKPKVEID